MYMYLDTVCTHIYMYLDTVCSHIYMYLDTAVTIHVFEHCVRSYLHLHVFGHCLQSQLHVFEHYLQSQLHVFEHCLQSMPYGEADVQNLKSQVLTLIKEVQESSAKLTSTTKTLEKKSAR